jgi:nitrate/nitrite transporter NarK
MVGINILGVGIGFLVPTLVVQEESLGDVAKGEIQSLYLGYMALSAGCLLLNFVFMRPRPAAAPSSGAEAVKVASTVEALKQIGREKNMLMFLIAYCLSYGSFIAFASNCNFIIKPYGYSDL